MDQGIADTLAELQLKIGELERALRTITEPATDPTAPVPASPPGGLAPAAVSAPAADMSAPAAVPAAATIVPGSAQPMPAPAAGREEAHQGRIIDEALERHGPDGASEGAAGGASAGEPAPAPPGQLRPRAGQRANLTPRPRLRRSCCDFASASRERRPS